MVRSDCQETRGHSACHAHQGAHRVCSQLEVVRLAISHKTGWTQPAVGLCINNGRLVPSSSGLHHFKGWVGLRRRRILACASGHQGGESGNP